MLVPALPALDAVYIRRLDLPNAHHHRSAPHRPQISSPEPQYANKRATYDDPHSEIPLAEHASRQSKQWPQDEHDQGQGSASDVGPAQGLGQGGRGVLWCGVRSRSTQYILLRWCGAISEAPGSGYVLYNPANSQATADNTCSSIQHTARCLLLTAPSSQKAASSCSTIGISFISAQSKFWGLIMDTTMHTMADREMATTLPASMGKSPPRVSMVIAPVRPCVDSRHLHTAQNSRTEECQHQDCSQACSDCVSPHISTPARSIGRNAPPFFHSSIPLTPGPHQTTHLGNADPGDDGANQARDSTADGTSGRDLAPGDAEGNWGHSAANNHTHEQVHPAKGQTDLPARLKYRNSSAKSQQSQLT